MNFLAHLFLDSSSDDTLLGSLLGDFVKGDIEGRFSTEISDSILLHRKIDSFADSHMVTRKSRNRISTLRGRFAGIIVDVCYDHFLSRHWLHFSTIDLKSFVDRVYAVLIKNRSLLPERLRRILPFMISQNWLGSYIHLEKVGYALDRIAGRLSRGGQFKRAVTEIEANYEVLEIDFFAFFPDLIAFVGTRKALAMEVKNQDTSQR